MDSPEDPAGRTITFEAPGEHYVGVTATDEGGAASTAGARVLVLDAEEAYFFGDVNDDQSVDALDVDATEDMVANGSMLDLAALDRADVDLDGRVTEEDLALISGAADAGQDAPRFISTLTGAPTRAVWMIHPELLDPADAAPML